jgi:arginine deiminase
MSAYVGSEVEPIEAVVIHSPGAEIESMTPKTAHEVLYNDIIPIQVVRDEHLRLKKFLSGVCEVYEVSELVGQALEVDPAREALVRLVCDAYWCRDREAELLELPPATLAETLIAGLPARKDSVTSYISRQQYDIPPLPNLYFMRDSSVVIRDRVVIGAMAFDVRSNEALLMNAAFKFSPTLANSGIVFDGSDSPQYASANRRPGAALRLEGGDVLVLRPDLLMVGISERTSSTAIDVLVTRIADAWPESVRVIAVVLPEERSTIHLDMIFTMIDREAALVYEPYVTGAGRREVLSIELRSGEEPCIIPEEGILPALARAGITLEAVACGGSDDVVRQREQWLSGNNVFAFAPGKIIGYDCNEATMGALASAGFAVRPIQVFLDGDDKLDNYERLVVAMPGINLARGGGGPRCMTLPIRRAPLSS